MRRADLERELEPVREFFRGREVNRNTVLAAHMRALGVVPTGEPWQHAKELLKAGATFKDAAAVAAGRLPGSSPSGEKVTERPRPTLGPSDERGQADTRQPSSKGSARIKGSPRAAGVPMRTRSGDMRKTPEQEEGQALQWFPKQFGPGDIDGSGARRLLGTPDMELAEVLVRETAQNSWDARGAGGVIEFTINLRTLDTPTIETLRSRIFTGEASGTGLAELLERDTIRVIEISDRGTVGLGGPIRNDLAVKEGETTDFIDLVFNIGAPRDTHLGGGTYGFGKTVSYVVSEVGTVLLWSRCVTPDGYEHRLIGSAIGDAFDRDGFRYTGRHWWGRAFPAEDRVEPVVGGQALGLAEQIFTRGFDHDETGTSLMIVSPRLGGDTAEGDVASLVDAMIWNLWPKLMADQAGRDRMMIRLQLDGVDIEIPPVEDHPVIGGHIACLRAVRAKQAGQDPADLRLMPPVDVREVRSERPIKLLGHIGLTRYPIGIGQDAPSRGITLMRNEAELVVKVWDRAPLDVEGFQWAAVFKPVADVDDSFAHSEPPAHDDWVPKAIADTQQRRDVSVALTRIKTYADGFIKPYDAVRSGEVPMESAAAAGDALAGLLGGVAGTAPAHQSRSRTTDGQRAARPRVSVINNGAEESHAPGWTSGWVDVQLSQAGGARVAVEVKVLVGVEGGSEDDDLAVRRLGWVSEDGGGHEPSAAVFVDGEIRRYEFEARSDLAIDIMLKMLEG